MSNILLADTNRSTCLQLEASLTAAGYQVFLAQNEETFRRWLQQESIAVVILDSQLVVAGRHSLLADIQQQAPATKIILLSESPPHEIREGGLDLAADDYLNQPYDAALLVNKIQRLLQKKVQRQLISQRLIGASPSMKHVQEMISKVANLNVRVLITGESGTGKGVIARLLHESGSENSQPFIHLDCGSLSESLIESELFGYERGAFTGALKQTPGKFEQAGAGVIFLDEIGALPLDLQVKLLTVLQDKRFFRLGGTEPIKMRAKIIAATNEDLEEKVAQGLFRADLFYRLNVVRIEVPSLRRRKEDIPSLAEFFIRQASQKFNTEIRQVEPGFFASLTNYDWPGNIRELEHALESAVALAESNTLYLTDLPHSIYQQVALPEAVKEGSLFRDHLAQQEVSSLMFGLEQCGGHRAKTAEFLGISRRSLQYKLKKYDLLS